MKVYKIRNSEGLFSTGGMRPRFTKQGKMWQQLGHVHGHISQLTTVYTPADIYKDAEIVEAEITEILTVVEPAKKYLIAKYTAEIEYYNERLNQNPQDSFYIKYLNRAVARRAALNE